MNSILTPETVGSSTGNKQPHKAGKTIKKATWKKPQDKPKRPLTAYNYFFQHERRQAILAKRQNEGDSNLNEDTEKMLQESSNGKRRRRHRRTSGLGFASLAQLVADKWKNLTDGERKVFQKLAENDKIRYESELTQWNKKRIMDKFLRDSDFSFVPSHAAVATNYPAIPNVPVPAMLEMSYPRMSLSESLTSTDNIIAEAKAFLHKIQQEQDMAVHGNSIDVPYAAFGSTKEVASSLQGLSARDICPGYMSSMSTEVTEVASVRADPTPHDTSYNCDDEASDDSFMKLLEECGF